MDVGFHHGSCFELLLVQLLWSVTSDTSIRLRRIDTEAKIPGIVHTREVLTVKKHLPTPNKLGPDSGDPLAKS